MENNLRTDISFNKESMTKEQAEAYDEFIDLLVDLCRKYEPLLEAKEEQVSAESVI